VKALAFYGSDTERLDVQNETWLGTLTTAAFRLWLRLLLLVLRHSFENLFFLFLLALLLCFLASVVTRIGGRVMSPSIASGDVLPFNVLITSFIITVVYLCEANKNVIYHQSGQAIYTPI
jgi:uncharacterized membrane protein (DUF485 family)